MSKSGKPKSIIDLWAAYAKTPEGKAKMEEGAKVFEEYQEAGRKLSKRIDEKFGWGEAMRIAAMPPLTWDIWGDPRPQQRPRASNLGKVGARMYVPSCPWRKHVGRGLKALDMPYYPKGVPVRVALVFRVSRPKAHYGTGRNAGTLKPSAPVAPLAGYTGAAKKTKIGDTDNYAKAVLDEMSGICFDDDCQVVELSVTKLYADYAGPGVTISYGDVR